MADAHPVSDERLAHEARAKVLAEKIEDLFAGECPVTILMATYMAFGAAIAGMTDSEIEAGALITESAEGLRRDFVGFFDGEAVH